jgi:hypothetical protein
LAPAAGPLGSNLAGQERFEPEFPRLYRQPRWSEGLFLLQHQVLLFLKQALALAPKRFTLVSVINGSEVLLSCEHKTAGQDQATQQQ